MSIRNRIVVSLVSLLSVALLAGCETGPQVKSEAAPPQTVAAAPKAAEAPMVKGKVKTVVGKSNTLSIEVGKELKVFKFTSDTTFKNAASYKDLHADELLKIEFKTVGSETIATVITKVVAELPKGTSLIKTEEMQQLVAKGPEAGNYVLFDARPAGRYHQAHIPTSLSLPFAEMEKLDKEGKVSPLLPQDKNKLVVFYCGGPT